MNYTTFCSIVKQWVCMIKKRKTPRSLPPVLGGP